MRPELREEIIVIDIRVMTINDYEGVNDLWNSIPEMGINKTDDSREGIEKYLKRNPATSFVAADGEKIVGAVLAGHDGRRGFIQHMAVLPEYRKRGIASGLVEKTMSALENEGIHKVALVAFQKNETGNAFWEHLGFTKREDLFYRNKSIHELEYRKNPFRES